MNTPRPGRYVGAVRGGVPPRRSTRRGPPILTGIDTADLPEAVVLECVLAETVNGLTAHAGHAAVGLFDRLEENARVDIDTLSSVGFATAKGHIRRYEQFSFVDAAVVACTCKQKSSATSTRSTATSTPPRMSIVYGTAIPIDGVSPSDERYASCIEHHSHHLLGLCQQRRDRCRG